MYYTLTFMQFWQKIWPRTSVILFLWGLTGIFIIIAFLIAHYKIKSAPATVALHYNVIGGVDLLGKKTDYYKIPLAGLVIGGINFAAYRFATNRRDFAAFLCALVSALAGLILLSALLFLSSVN